MIPSQTDQSNGNANISDFSEEVPTRQALVDNLIAPPSASKRKTERSAATYPRKRAVIACETCRKRKVKCDNQRPSCGGCADLEIECVFRNSKTDHSTYDLASLEILERINYVAGLLENQHDTLSTHILRANSDAEILLESLEIAGRTPGVSEDILEWPIFGGRYDRTKVETLIFNPHAADYTYHVPTTLGHYPSDDQRLVQSVSSDPIRMSTPGRGVQEDDVLRLIDKFLVNVHIKNPILDVGDLKRKARFIVENGFGWDAASCLVLIVCALASISSTFTPEPVTPALVNGEDGKTSISDAHDYSTAESYYIAAQKRISVLGNSIPTTQCYFLSGVYEMYSLRPLKAWKSFNSACITLQIYLRGRSQQIESASRSLERRLYWSCLKSECELRMEINLPPSGLAKVNYPDVFPTPPNRSPEPSDYSTTPEAVHQPSVSTRHLGEDSEDVWSYYVSEIAVRRIGNRLMNSFYKEDESSWLSMPLDRMIRVADELELQLTQWFEHLPATLAAKGAAGPAPHNPVVEELQFVLHARLFDFRERIYRPFLYLAIHYDPTDLIQQTLLPYVHRCIQACLMFLLRGTPRHRHHGTWYENRGMFLKSLLLIAAVKSSHIAVPSLWRQGVDSCIAGFQFWELESPDLRESRLVLQSLLAEIV
ncbi:hypothetical protein OIDMADRAFT_160650 [Oidiodendron maius Zn]|uniref:Zn(2)-C6 fungal-type domain-containing protein n=1 Tax=Oidiodendron maius (strain Zn) TaxID=913774 RepID=A0A0C3H4I2_OIDMZ|nr:hypothetical protein OIDMADRAFT_160650 [Oidiodendron maius Zn]